MRSMLVPSFKDMSVMVDGYKDGNVYLSVSVPERLLKSFVSLLSSLHGFFHYAELQTKTARAYSKAVDPVEIEKRERYLRDKKEEVLNLFDQFMRDGVPVRESIKRTAKALKDRNHPYGYYDGVYQVLSSSGKLKKTGLYSKKKG